MSPPFLGKSAQVARRTRIEILDAIVHDGVVPVFYDPDVDVTREVATTLVAGGLSTLEFTNRGDGAVDVLAALIAQSRDSLPELIVGAGSIVDAATAAHVIDLGVNFVFAPSFSREVAGACHLRNIPYVPGCATMTEILDAYRCRLRFRQAFSSKLDRRTGLPRGSARSVSVGAGDTNRRGGANGGVTAVVVPGRCSCRGDGVEAAPQATRRGTGYGRPSFTYRDDRGGRS